MPILQELVATGGKDDVRFLYERLIAYFPQIEEREIFEIKNDKNINWRKAVQKAGRNLDEKSYLKRNRGLWTITEKGKEAARAETSSFTLPNPKVESTTHLGIQELVVEIGFFLGFHAEIEFEYYDVVWREKPHSARLSHIFEVQSKGNIDSAFAKLKRAYQIQRTKPFLIVSSERDLNRARQSLTREFQDIETAVTILTFVQVKHIHRNLKAISEVLPKFLEH
jgi:23S rRNA pseudoU1915 N3-methylase RlmH